MGRRIAAELVDMGLISETALAEALAKLTVFPVVHTLPEAIPYEILRKVPAGIARELEIVPLDVVSGVLRVAMIDPSDDVALSIVRSTVQMKIEPLIALRGAVAVAVDRFYPETPDVDTTLFNPPALRLELDTPTVNRSATIAPEPGVKAPTAPPSVSNSMPPAAPDAPLAAPRPPTREAPVPRTSIEQPAHAVTHAEPATPPIAPATEPPAPVFEIGNETLMRSFAEPLEIPVEEIGSATLSVPAARARQPQGAQPVQVDLLTRLLELAEENAKRIDRLEKQMDELLARSRS